MAYRNTAELIGRLTRDPELRYTQTGKPVCNFSVALNSTWRDDKGVKHEDTEFVKVVAWGATAEAVAENMTKGRLVFVEGKIKIRPWTKEVKAKSGEVIKIPMETAEVHAVNVQFLDYARTATTVAGKGKAGSTEQAQTEQPTDEQVPANTQEQQAAESTPEDEGF